MKVGLVILFHGPPEKIWTSEGLFPENQLLVGGWVFNPFEKYAQVKLG